MGAKRNVTAGQERRDPPVLDSYARLSRVPETGELEKIDTQHADNHKVIERLGGVLGRDFDDGLSAWKRNVRRKDWEDMLERVKTGVSDGIVVWHTDRLFRQPRDLETLIELANKGFIVASAHGARNLSDPDDRFILRIEVAHAARSSDDTSRRAKRRFAAMREKGVPVMGGARQFGFPGLDPKWRGPEGERREVPAEQVERERQGLLDATLYLNDGGELAQVARDWNEAGLLTINGREWNGETVRDTMQRPLLAGWIVYDGTLVSRIEGKAILTDEQFERLQATFTARKSGRAVGEKYVGTGIIQCDNCERVLSAHAQGKNYSDGERRSTYFCHKARGGCGRVYADVRGVDAQLRELTILRMSDPRHAAAIRGARAKVAGRLAQVRKEIEEIVTLQNDLSDRLGHRRIKLEAFDIANEPLARDLAKLIEERDSLPGGAEGAEEEPIRPEQVESPEEVAARWDNPNTPLAERRKMLRDALEGACVRVARRGRGGSRTFDPERVQLLPLKPRT